MSIERTCGNCENVFKGGVMNMPIAACKITDYVIPHHSDHKQVTFWRIPLDCPKTENVFKSEKQAPRKEWVIKQWSEFN